jgi:Rad3-related DNA helicase
MAKTTLFTSDVVVLSAATAGSTTLPLSDGRRQTRRIDFSRFDATGRQPRPVQLQFLEWLADNWDEADVLAGQLPVGSGKSFIAESIKVATGGHALTPSNVLVDQYVETYPQRNYLRGKATYGCRSGLTCSDWIDTMEQEPCGDCPYTRCRERAKSEPTYFNPMSYHYAQRIVPRPKVLVVDEAHQLSSMLLMLCAKKFRYTMYRWTSACLSEIYLLKWMDEKLRQLQKLLTVYAVARDAKALVKLREIAGEIESLTLVRAAVADDPANYAIYIEQGKHRGKAEKFLVVRPVRPPRLVVRRMLNCDKLILLSGTLLPTDIEDLAGDRAVRVVDLPSPIPRERRPILYRPVPFAMNFHTDPKRIVEAIERVLEEFPDRNTIVHVSYALSVKLFPHFKRRVHQNTSTNKTEVLERFKRDGGVFLAAGCAEGIDLRDDLCRLNIIPQLQFPNLADVVVQKRKAQEGGEDWYGMLTLQTVQQATGRSTRHADDHSITVILDPNFSRLVNRLKAKLPQSFIESISWTGCMAGLK